MIQNEKLKSHYVYISHLARCCKKFTFFIVILPNYEFLCTCVCVHACMRIFVFSVVLVVITNLSRFTDKENSSGFF